MKQQLRLPSLLLTGAILIGSLTTAQAQKAPVRKPAAPHGFNLKQIIEVYMCEDLATVNDFLNARGFQFGKSTNEESTSQVVFIHRNSSGTLDASFNIYFCNSPDNEFCMKKEGHGDGNRQHIYTIRYNISKPVFDKLRNEMKELKEPTGSYTGENEIATIFEGGGYRFMYFTNTETSIPRYYIKFREVPLEQE